MVSNLGWQYVLFPSTTLHFTYVSLPLINVCILYYCRMQSAGTYILFSKQAAKIYFIGLKFTAADSKHEVQKECLTFFLHA